MITATLFSLCITAFTIAFLHTASGPDHYLPFIVLSRSRGWSVSKNILITVLCGLGHVFSSVVLGLIGVVLGWQLSKISWLQDVRGNISGWALLAFGVIYLAYGIRKAYQNRPHKHFDLMGEEVYVYEHRHGETVQPNKRVKVTPLVLFAIFVMGPTEPLIPLLFFSGTNHSVMEEGMLITVFTLTTVLTMLVMVLLGCYGYSFLRTERLERYVHAIGGGVVTMCAFGMLFLGW